MRPALTALLALLALAAPSTASAVGALEPQQWRVNNTTTINGAESYELINMRKGQLGYDNRVFGVDLGWVGHSGGHFRFLRRNARDHRQAHQPQRAARALQHEDA